MQRPNLDRKELLNPKEAIEYFGLSGRKFYQLLKQESMFFLVYYGDRKLIIKSEFENYLLFHPELRKEERSGRPKKRQQTPRS